MVCGCAQGMKKEISDPTSASRRSWWLPIRGLGLADFAVDDGLAFALHPEKRDQTCSVHFDPNAAQHSAALQYRL